MNLLLITTIYPTADHPNYGTFVAAVAQLYQSQGHCVDRLAFLREGSRIQKMGHLFRFYRSLWASKEPLRSGAYDIVNVHYPYLAAPAMRRLPLNHTALVTHVHGSDVFGDSLSKKLMGPATAALLARSHSIVVPSRFFREKLLQRYPLPPERVWVCPPGGYDPEVFSPKGPRLNALDPARPWVGFAGRLVEGKGWRTCLQAFAAAVSQRGLEDAGLAIVGTGVDAPALWRESEALGLQGRVVFLGALPHHQMAAFYRSLEVFLFPTHLEESLGMVGVEALACGTPVLASRIGGIQEYLRDGDNGFLLPPKDSGALSESLVHFFQMEAPKRAALQAASAPSVTAYQAPKVAQRLEEILDASLLLARRGPRP
ncbi:hypothetical protein ABB02_00702 [Clostridiaceae bacterium JG1575]|nr:hypothetical protein ABB02_00702 [Clostridiaceae bacterium JG1575]